MLYLFISIVYENSLVSTYLKVHKIENFFGSDIEICTFS
jgi:hypothetical protein